MSRGRKPGRFICRPERNGLISGPDRRLPGGQTITADAPIDKIPLLVRAGSIIPMGPFIQYAAEKPADPIELRIYPGADGKFHVV